VGFVAVVGEIFKDLSKLIRHNQNGSILWNPAGPSFSVSRGCLLFCEISRNSASIRCLSNSSNSFSEN
jgi:hypothetical protein